jgi:uncharacterized SAM-binding protein YcdF (DUF218 family)
MGLAISTLSVALLWIISCHGTAVWLARTSVPQFAPLNLATLKASKAQAIVVLGGGMLPEAPEYGEAQPGGHTLARLRYGLWLHKQSGIPVAFTGGNGWGTAGDYKESEAEVTARAALTDYGVTLRWLEGQSRDTSENARFLAPMLKRDGVQHILLVTDAWHMPRSVVAFERAGLTVTAAPIGYLLSTQNDWLEWLPSASGLPASQQVLREWLGLTASRWLTV